MCFNKFNIGHFYKHTFVPLWVCSKPASGFFYLADLQSDKEYSYPKYAPLPDTTDLDRPADDEQTILHFRR
jgi:hypothetical protein